MWLSTALMADTIKRSLKECSKLAKCYYKNGHEKSDHGKLFKKPLFVLKAFSKLKITTFLKWPQTFKIQRL